MNDFTVQSTNFRKHIRPLMGLFLFGFVSHASALTVTVSIPPLAGIVAPLLGPEDELNILLKPGVSPHGFQLKPSHVKLLQDSDLVISVGTPVDGWIEKPLQRVHKTSIAMANMENVEQLTLRQGGLWEKKHAHNNEPEHRETDSDVHQHGSTEHEHEAAEHVSTKHEVAEDESASHNHEKPVESMHLDGHLWMSLHNAKQMVLAVSQRLQIMLPEQKKVIEQRTVNWLVQLDKTDQRIVKRLAKVKTEPFLVLHDAFQYFEHQYGLNGVGSIRLNPELAPSLKRVHELRERIKSGHVTCLFKEPQFPEKRVMSVVTGLDVKLGSLDPMGTSYSLGKPFMAYDAFLEALANQFSNCLMSDKGH